MSSSFLKLNLTVKSNVKDDLFQIYKTVKPNLSEDDFVYEEMSGGFVNLLHRVYSKNDPKDSVVFRTFDGKFDMEEIESFFKDSVKISKDKKKINFEEVFFNREKEVMIMDTLSKYNLCKPVIAKYLNGVCFGYAQGVTSNGPLMLTNDYLNKIALKLAEFHLVKIELPSCDIDTHFELMAKYSSPSEKGFSDMFQAEIDKIKEFPFNDYPKFSEIKQIEEDLILKLEKIGYGETGLCHNDLNQKNIIWDPQERDLSLIDFEQTMNNYVGYDIGYFYVSITGHFLGDVDEDLFPKNNYRLKLVRRYLEEKYKLKNEKPDNESFEEEVKKLNIRSNLYALSFMIRLLSLSLFFAFKPELFRKTDFSGDKLQNSINCGLYGYKIIKLFHKTKFDLLKPYESYFNDEKN